MAPAISNDDIEYTSADFCDFNKTRLEYKLLVAIHQLQYLRVNQSLRQSRSSVSLPVQFPKGDTFKTSPSEQHLQEGTLPMLRKTSLYPDSKGSHPTDTSKSHIVLTMREVTLPPLVTLKKVLRRKRHAHPTVLPSLLAGHAILAKVRTVN
ncbi:unnamed protein product [Bursaphelenchus okinawaensis]|uniref:Uncharacterized protein n=1 Tax=Bursaphelenchus okinawaensis TaxID=465554 RepID=A0A811K6Y7_9BILA|nr:unnamed protein product [Bursaphelenchus okinawaensis]CAG9092709.1 unnamed protein product [Bursaphelenchus okinawaensis]